MWISKNKIDNKLSTSKQVVWCGAAETYIYSTYMDVFGKGGGGTRKTALSYDECGPYNC